MAEHQLASALTRARAERQWTQQELHERSGVSLATIGAIERGERERINASTCGRLDAAFEWEPGTTAALFESEPSPVDAGERREVVDRIVALDDAPYARLVEYLDEIAPVEQSIEDLRAEVERLKAQLASVKV